MEIELRSIIYNLIPHSIFLIAWVVAVVFAVRMFKHGGARAERFLLIGVSLMLASSVVGSIFTAITPWIVFWVAGAGGGAKNLGIVFSIIGAFRSLVSLAGIIYLVYAFWKKFRTQVST